MSENEDDEEMGEDQEEDILVQGGREAENNSFGSSHFSLSQQIITNLKRQGLTTATEVQHQVIPKIQNERGKDLCVNAPTGSGKTLAYALPIIESLSKRRFTALGCVVVVPTRELVQQVREVFETCSRKMSLKIEVAHGQRNLAEEQAALVSAGNPGGLGGSMLVDILIATPGRLAEHILHTPRFTLQHLKFLVLDEADRLLHQSFQNWTNLVIQEISSPKVLQQPVDPVEILRGTTEIPIVGQRYLDSVFGQTSLITRPVRKLIFSATLSYDVGKFASLEIQSPEIISVLADPKQDINENDVDEPIFSLPTTLREFVLSGRDDKPLLLIYMLDKFRIRERTLIFTNSTETATRLHHLLERYYRAINSDVTVAVISSEVPGKVRKKLLSLFTPGKLTFVITTDLLSRGMDIRGILHVVNYDSPPTARSYVHRAGRTARAGETGDVWSLVTDRDARWFWKSVVGEINRSSKPERIQVKKEEISQVMRDIYHTIIE